MTIFEPRIMAFCCHPCTHTGADLEGPYPQNVQILKLPCTGKMDVGHILRAFEQGADGVIVASCIEGDCHFQDGNLRAKKRVQLVKQIVEEAGLEPERLEMFNLSFSAGQTFADITREVTERVRALGPSPLRSPECRVQSI